MGHTTHQKLVPINKIHTLKSKILSNFCLRMLFKMIVVFELYEFKYLLFWPLKWFYYVIYDLYYGMIRLIDPKNAKIGWNWPSGSGEDLKKKNSMYFCSSNHLPLEKEVALQYLNKLELSSSKDALCRNLVEIGLNWFLRGRFLNFVNVFSLFHNYLP